MTRLTALGGKVTIFLNLDWPVGNPSFWDRRLPEPCGGPSHARGEGEQGRHPCSYRRDVAHAHCLQKYTIGSQGPNAPVHPRRDTMTIRSTAWRSNQSPALSACKESG